MSLRHVIVEGPDGSGKTSLIEKLRQNIPHLTHHLKASTSQGGPIPDLAQWTVTDVQTMASQAPSIYDRHPLISEPIYGSLLRTEQDSKFFNADWISLNLQRASQNSLLLLCMPRFYSIEKNVRASQDNQMGGVVENIETIVHLYNMFYELRVWPGVLATYDYEQEQADLRIISLVRRVVC